MATEIKFNADGTINFGDYTLTFTDEGFEFDGSILATEYETVPPQAQGSISGYTSGGSPTPANYVNTIDKFPFAVDANATDVGDLTQANRSLAGQSSTESGYSSGGFTPPYTNVIQKFPFAVDANATDVGDLTSDRGNGSGQSSTTFGYMSGGFATLNNIDKFPFASDGNATDVGDLTQARRDSTQNQQV